MDTQQDVAMVDATNPREAPAPKSKKRKSSSQSHEIKTLTIKSPTFSYIHLTLQTSSLKPASADILTYRTYLTQALTQFLGVTGSSISIDIIKIDHQDLWIRVPRQDCSAVVAAVGGWTSTERGGGEELGWRLRGSSNWLGCLLGQQGVEKVWGN